MGGLYGQLALLLRHGAGWACWPAYREPRISDGCCPPSSLTATHIYMPQIDGETVSLVVPCADMANHVLRPSASYAFSPEEDAFVLRALRVRAVPCCAMLCCAAPLWGAPQGWAAWEAS